MYLLLLLHVAFAVIAMAVGPRLGRRVFLLVLPAPLITFGWAVSQHGAVTDGEVPTETFAWVPALGLALDLRLNGIALLFTLLIAGVGALVFWYASNYFSDRAGLSSFAATLILFAGGMLGLVWSDNLLGLFVFWEITSICSYLLIGFDDRNETARNSALQALLITGAGGLALLAGAVLVATEAGTYNLTELLADPPTGSVVNAGLVLMLLGAFTKSAQVPFHGWLPGAMAAPTPVSAYLHSATMVKAGVYLVAVLAPAFATAGPWRPLTVGVGGLTMLWGGYQSIRKNDLKLILAYGTIAALGALIALFGLGTPKTTFAAVAVLVAHALYKASLFMIVGIVDHQAHSRDIFRLRGLRHVMPATAAVAAAGAVSMAALPATLGFVSKEGALVGLLDADLTAATVTLFCLLGFSAFTVAAVWRFWVGAFTDGPAPAASIAGRTGPHPDAGPDAGPDDDPADTGHDPAGPNNPVETGPVDPAGVRAPSPAFLAPAGLLAAAGLILGMLPRFVDGLAITASSSLDTAAGVYHLYAFDGFNTAFFASMAALAVGGMLIAAQAHVARAQQQVAFGPNAGDVFKGLVMGLLRLAQRVVAIVQSGSLPIYLAVILLTFVVVPGVALLPALGIPDGAIFAESPLQAAAAVALVVAALGVTVVQRRFAAALMLGAVGYAMAVLFVAYDAPDLALTQFLVETIVVVAFVLVLRRLPEEFAPVNWPGRQALRIVTSVGVAVLVFAFLLVAGSGKVAPPPTEELVAASFPEGGGKNVVNVILTDIRALDTLGEISVVAVAALGVMSLTVLAPRPRRRIRSGPTPPPSPEPTTSRPMTGPARSKVLDLTVRTVAPLAFLFALFMLLSGHNAPGGGFIGGLVASAVLVLRFVNDPDDKPLWWERPGLLIGGGLTLSVAVAMAGWVNGSPFFDMRVAEWDLGPIGAVKLTSALPFDIGVFALVMGMTVAILHSFGGGRMSAGDSVEPDDRDRAETHTAGPVDGEPADRDFTEARP